MAKHRPQRRPSETEPPDESPGSAGIGETNPESTRRAEALTRFLKEQVWEKPLQERHAYFLTLKEQDIPAEDLMEFAASLVTGLPHIGRQGYLWPDKPPFDLAAADETILVDAKLFDSGVSRAQNVLKVKRERPRKQFRRWTEGGERAIPCQLACGRSAWFVVPGIPTKDVPLKKAVTANLVASDPLKPLRLLDRADISEWNDFAVLHTNWSRALEHLRQNHGAIMRKVKEEREKFTAKEAKETLVDSFERPIWIATALQIPEARDQIVEQVFQDEESTQQIVEQAFQHEQAKQQIVEQAFQDKETTQQIVEQAFQHQDAKQQIVEQVLQDDEVMRVQLGEELFHLWKARQQAARPVEPPAEQPPAAPRKNGRGNKKKP